MNKARLNTAKAWVEEALVHSARVEEDEIYKTLLELIEERLTRRCRMGIAEYNIVYIREQEGW